MNRHTSIRRTSTSPTAMLAVEEVVLPATDTSIGAGLVNGLNSPTGEAGAPNLSNHSKMPCRECDGKGEAEYIGLAEDRYHWRDCHVCDGTGLVEPYCEVCEGKLTVDGFCYSCDSYPEGLVCVERIAPGRVAL